MVAPNWVELSPCLGIYWLLLGYGAKGFERARYFGLWRNSKIGDRNHQRQARSRQLALMLHYSKKLPMLISLPQKQLSIRKIWSTLLKPIC